MFIATDSEYNAHYTAPLTWCTDACIVVRLCFIFVLPEWLPNLSKLGRKKVNHAITEPLSPVLVKR